MDKKEFIEIVNEGIRRNKAFIAVRLETEGDPYPEIRINCRNYVNAIYRYYLSAYNDNMVLIDSIGGKETRITKVLMTDDLTNMEWFTD